MAAAKRTPRKSPKRLKGKLVMWNDQKGFGFIRPNESDDDFFVHISAFKQGMPRRPLLNDSVQFQAEEREGKRRALFAVVENLELAPEPLKPGQFELNPKRRSWLVNLLIALPLLLSGYLLLITQNPVPFMAYWFLSLITMYLYGTDQAHAVTHQRRIPEGWLHLLELLGGWPGALMAQNDFRHKTRMSTYLVIQRGIIALHLIAWILYFIYAQGGNPAMRP
jgi:uncharacterized membrane protein YsdA (DUF1294 family)/cold shock CspA family protein